MRVRFEIYRLMNFAALAAIAFAFAFPMVAFATGSGGDCTSGSGDPGSCGNCISALIYQNVNSGSQVINATFTALNGVLNDVQQSFYNGFVNASGFQQMIGTGIVLYVAIYGLMITFKLNSYKVSEVSNRLIKVAIVYMMTAPGSWVTFNTWVANPVIGEMNQLIREFTQVAEGGSNLTHIMLESGGAYGSQGSGGLDAAAFSNMFGPSLTVVFSMQLWTAIESMIKTGFFGWLISIFLVFGIFEFALMIVGAFFTYAKSIIGLAFLFGVAPLFFIFLLFDKTRQIFTAWTAQVLTFALQPVMLFAFLSFYVALVSQAASKLLTDPSGNVTDFCWDKWFSIPGTLWDSFGWHPTDKGAQTDQAWNDPSGNVKTEPISVTNALFFLMLCHLGRSFVSFINTLSQSLAEGSGGGVTTAEDVKQTFSNMKERITGSRGRGGS